MDSLHALQFFTAGVSPFGNPRIEAYLQLPAAYRSLSRPSSAPCAKAFTLCSCSLELSFFFPVLSFELLEFHKQIILVVNSLWKGFILLCFESFSTFRWNCNFTQIGKTFWFFANLLVLNLCVLLSVRFLLFNTLFGFQWTYLCFKTTHCVILKLRFCSMTISHRLAIART